MQKKIKLNFFKIYTLASLFVLQMGLIGTTVAHANYLDNDPDYCDDGGSSTTSTNALDCTSSFNGSGGGFLQALQYIKKNNTQPHMYAPLSNKTLKEICYRFVSYGIDGLNIISLLIQSGGINKWEDPNLLNINDGDGTKPKSDFKIGIRNQSAQPTIVTTQLLSKIVESSRLLCEDNKEEFKIKFEINFNILDSNNNVLVARNYFQDKIEVNIEKLTPRELAKTCETDYAWVNKDICPFLLLRMIASHELLSRYDRKIESDGIYHLSGKIIKILGKMGHSGVYSGTPKDPYENTSYTKYIYEIFRAVTNKQHSTIECLKGANRDGSFLIKWYKDEKLTNDQIQADITKRIKDLRSLLDLAQNASSIIDRALDHNLDLGKKIRDDAIDEILCLKNLEHKYLSEPLWKRIITRD